MIKKLSQSLTILVLIAVCIGCNHKETVSKSDLFDTTQYFNKSIPGIISATSLIGVTENFLLFTNEREFLHANNYNYYIIFYHKEQATQPYIYTIKSLNGTTLISKKTIQAEPEGFFLFENAHTSSSSHISIHTSSRIAGEDSLLNYKSVLDRAVKDVHPYKRSYCGDSNSFVYYYNGKSYFELSNAFTNCETMKQIDSTFLSLGIFSDIEKNDKSN